jgi:dipeptidyl aminopeptidase/acylaminoacyl peptidase
VSDEAFEIIRGMFTYDPSPLEATIESVRDDHEHWREEIVSIRAAYGGERIPIHLFLPRSSRPPYQAVVYVPGSHVRQTPSSETVPLMFAEFIPRAGRALVFPVYKGTFERRLEVDGLHHYRDMLIQVNKDLRRTIDYLETRDDIDSKKLGYYGLSWGSTYGPMHTAIEDRFKASVLLAGGLFRPEPDRPAEIIPVNFAPRATVPVLLINSRNDFDAPIETNIRPLMDFLGAPPEHKKLVIIDGGHVPQSPNEFIREALDWYDRYLGPVEQR